MDRAPRRRHGAPERAPRRRVRPGALPRVRLRRRHRSLLPAPRRRAGHPRVPDERRPLAREVRTGELAMQVRVPVSWLREYVELAVPLEELARVLTLAGLETEVVNDKAEMWRRIWVARVTALE